MPLDHGSALSRVPDKPDHLTGAGMEGAFGQVRQVSGLNVPGFSSGSKSGGR